MSAMPGRMQAAFTAGEINRSLFDRTTLKYFSTGAALMENVVIIPQGGFTIRDGLRDIGAVRSNARRILSMDASDGSSYDLVFSSGHFQAWDATTMLQDVAIGISDAQLTELSDAQRFDTMILFEKTLKPQRIKIYAPNDWRVDDAPFSHVPTWDYGAVYTNGVPAVWELEFTGLGATTVFRLTVSQVNTTSMNYDADHTALAAAIQAALIDLPNVFGGIAVTVSGDKIRITFSGANNIGDGWAVSADVINKADAAVLASKITAGVEPGEAVMSATRGYPRCGVFTQQRLLVGGFKSLPGAWMASKTSDYYNFDRRFTQANGPFLIPMDVDGGEAIVAIVDNLNLLIFTSKAEYWLSERSLSRDQAPNHVQASRNGTKAGVTVVENEGAALYCWSNGNVLSEMRYTDVQGNFVSTDISLLAPHLVENVFEQAIRKATNSTSGNQLAVLRGDGEARIATLLRQQEVTAFARMTSPGTFISAASNGRNELSFLMQRSSGRRLERMESGLLLDEAVTLTYGTPKTLITGLTRLAGRTVWAIADGDVFGPFACDGSITLPKASRSVTVGTWSPPKVTTLPPARDIGPNVVLRRPARIHTVHLSLIDTTSVALAVNDGPAIDVNLWRYGTARADVPELEQGFEGVIKIPNLRGYRDEPSVTITQTRPGRLTVRSVTVEAQL